MGDSIKRYKKKHPLECVNCGICKSKCPIYKQTQNESYSARGRMSLIKAVNSNILIDTKELSERFYSCLLCGACTKTCPLHIDVTQSICEIRGKLNKKKTTTRLLSYLIKYGFKKPKYVFKAMGFFDYLCQHAPYKDRIDKLRRHYGITITPSKKSLTDTITLRKGKNPIGRVALYPGCSINYLFPTIGISLIEVLNLLDYDVVIPRQYLCCGAPQLAMGLIKEAEDIAKRQMTIFDSLSLDAVISLCPTCVHMMSDTYTDLLGEGIKGIIDTNRFISQNATKILNISDNLGSLYPNTPLVYHEPCHIRSYSEIQNNIPPLLKSLGLDFKYDENCCGFGGTFRFIETDLSNTITSNLKNSYAKDALVITSCPNCIIQFKNHNINSKHFIDIINYGMKG
ncbi:MAG: (Fe-S)-binding protein [Thermodesulfovibrionales bacterium]